VRGNTVNLTDPSGRFAGLILPFLGLGTLNDVTSNGGRNTGKFLQDLCEGDVLGGLGSAFELMLPTLEALGKVAIALAVSIAASVVITAATFVIAAAIGVTSTFALAVGATALFLSGIGGGQTFRATSNVLNGKNWDNGLFNGQDMVVDGALSVITFGIFSKFTGGGITTFGAQGLNAGRQTVDAAKNFFKADEVLLEIQYFSGNVPPKTDGATPISVYSHVDDSGRVVQNAIYNNNGDVMAHIDFKPHGSSPSGHGHLFTTPGKPSTGHGRLYPHYPPGYFPPEWYKIPHNMSPLTPIGVGK